MGEPDLATLTSEELLELAATSRTLHVMPRGPIGPQRHRDELQAEERLRCKLNRPGGGSNYVRQVCAERGIA